MKYIKEIHSTKNFLDKVNLAWDNMCLAKSTIGTVEVLVNGASGTNAPKEFCELFNIRDEQGNLRCSDTASETYWEDWYSILEDCTDDLQELASSYGIGAGFPHALLSISTNETDGDIEVQLSTSDDFWSEHTYCEECGEVTKNTLCSCKEVNNKLLITNFTDCLIGLKGGFLKKLCEAIVVADIKNTKALYEAFPELIRGYILYNKGLSWEQFLEQTGNR